MKRASFGWPLWLMVAGMASTPLLAEVPADLQQALDAQDYKKAYQLAESHSEALAGDPEFDYAYGQAALRNGHTEEAVFAFERVVVNDPYDNDARALLVEAYLELENSAAAQHEFEQLRRLSSDMDSQRMQNIADQLDVDMSTSQARVRGRVSFSVGYDSNLNQGLDDGGIYYQDYLQVEGNFAQLGGKVTYSKPMESGYVGYLKAAGFHRLYDNPEDTEIDTLALTAGIAKSDGDTSYNYSAAIKPLWTDGNLFRTLYQLNAGVSQNINEDMDYRIAAQWSYFDEDNDLADRNRLLVSAGLSKKLTSVSHQVMAYAGTEWADDSAGEHFARDIYGLSYRLTYVSKGSNSKTFAEVFYQRENYKGENPAYQFSFYNDSTLENDLAGVTLGHDRTIATDIILFGRYSYQNNSSNIFDLDDGIHPEDYERNFFQVGLRRQF